MKKSMLWVVLWGGICFTACEKENIQPDNELNENPQIINKTSVNSDEKVFEANGIPPLPDNEAQKSGNPEPYQSKLENFYKEPNPEDLK